MNSVLYCADQRQTLELEEEGRPTNNAAEGVGEGPRVLWTSVFPWTQDISLRPVGVFM